MGDDQKEDVKSEEVIEPSHNDDTNEMNRDEEEEKAEIYETPRGDDLVNGDEEDDSKVSEKAPEQKEIESKPAATDLRPKEEEIKLDDEDEEEPEDDNQSVEDSQAEVEFVNPTEDEEEEEVDINKDNKINKEEEPEVIIINPAA